MLVHGWDYASRKSCFTCILPPSYQKKIYSGIKIVDLISERYVIQLFQLLRTYANCTLFCVAKIIEIFLTYLLTLNAAEYHSFTHIYTSTGRTCFTFFLFYVLRYNQLNLLPVITYWVLIVQARQSNMSACRPYLLLSGTVTDTQALYFASDRLELLFQVVSPFKVAISYIIPLLRLLFSIKNLGILTTFWGTIHVWRLGHWT